ncbi:DNA methyltransferase [Caulobacter sp. B11]|uniref:DNA adenine methylase n=1 Tax=Caulobacter sp. B11 TaxID=2048899 RepID=UPI000C12C9F7|nr:DNA adenine methylase [Caulobacter sp. B11]PHY14050.1 DNA methyltransferase [Caulobacter sp. B11]
MNCSRNVLTSPLAAVSPAEPAAPWIGGKRHLAKRICQILADTPHDAYCEPFTGMGGVFLRRAVRPGLEVINDVSGDVVTLFRVLRSHPEALLRELRWRPAMRVEFDRLKGAAAYDLTDIERAARFLYLQTLAFGGKVRGRNFGVDPVKPHNFDLVRLEPRLRRIHDRLAGVVIENLDWADFIPRYDRPGTLFYLDPPYYGSEDDYGREIFARADFQRLADHLARIQGQFLLSINDVPETRTVFAWAEIEAVNTVYSVSGSAQAGPAKELLVSSSGVRASTRQPSLL